MKKFILALLLLVLPHVSLGAEPKNSLDLICCSYHFDRTKDWNEQNTGVEYKRYIGPNVRFSIAVYDNSEYNTSYYVGIGREFPITKNIDFTLEGGLVAGYEQVPLFPMIVPGLSFYDRVHVRVTPVVIGASFSIIRW